MTHHAHCISRRRSVFIALSAISSLSGLAFCPSAASAQTSAATADAEVRKVMDAYIAASRNADAQAARALFHPKAIMTGATAGGQMGFGTPESFFGLLAKMAAEPKKPYGPARVTQVMVAGDIATGTVEEANFNGKRYTDMFQLVRQDGRWLIISKTWYGTPVD